MTKPALYHHFRFRDEIVSSLMEPVAQDAGAAADRFDRLSAAEVPEAAREFYADFVIRHRRIIHMVFFDRKAMPGDLPKSVDGLADRGSEALVGSNDPGVVAVGATLVYGVAALVARRRYADDAELRGLVDAVFEELPAGGAR